MTVTMETITVRGDGLTIPLLVWRRFRRPMPGLVEQILEINQGLADLGPFLPLGTAFDMPIPTSGDTAQPQARVKLW